MSAKKSHLTPARMFGLRLRELRQQRGWTQAELGKLAGFDRTTINKIESGARADVSISQLFEFADALGTSPLYLITPPLDSIVLEVGKRKLTPSEAREWIRGEMPPAGDPIEYLRDLPLEDLRERGQAMGYPTEIVEMIAQSFSFMRNYAAKEEGESRGK